MHPAAACARLHTHHLNHMYSIGGKGVCASPERWPAHGGGQRMPLHVSRQCCTEGDWALLAHCLLYLTMLWSETLCRPFQLSDLENLDVCWTLA